MGARAERTAWVAALALAAASGLRAQPPPASPATSPAPMADAPLAEVVVEGRHEGPRMWTVHRGDHTLWILGTVTPLPKKLVWQPDAVRAVLQQSQEVVPAWPTYGIGANPFTALRVFIQWRRMQKPPDRLPLRETLPPGLYARVAALEARYDPHDKHLEELRPMLAAERLTTKVLDASGLALRNEVQRTVLELARAQGVRVRQDKLKIEDPVDVLKDVGATPLSAEIACLDAVVTRLETDLGPMQARARAWALGDVETLRQLPHADDRTACIAAVSTSERVRTLIARAQDDWLLVVQDSLARNRGTLAVQSMDRLLGEHGALAALKARGYQVEGP
ncbi:MAG TPA: TraB/GumN family protein [Candidatus Dormibacteraeota bacterium]|nr:TraB/GumN family protein [Candidatus Dormibacteraeota bacterium]